jgi:STE24 endopeptidase
MGRVAVNGVALLIITALVARYLLELAADALSLRTLLAAPPPELAEIYEPERWRRAREYLPARTHFGMVAASVDLAALLGFWFAGGFGALDRAVRALGVGPITSGLLFVAALAVARLVVALPLRWWSTFVVEERFGFNRTTARTFWADLAKGIVMAAALGGPLLALVLWLFGQAGGRAWLWCWLASALWVVAVQFVAPAWIMPLFNRFTPLPDGTLREMILSYARAVRFPLEDVFVIDGSRRSTKANAFFTGFGRHRRIGLFDTLLAKLDPAEVVAVVAHEVGHYRRHHVGQGLVLALLQLGAAFFLLAVVLDWPALYAAFGVETPSVHAGLVFFSLLLTPLNLAVSVLMGALSRHNEREADRFAVETTGKGAPLASALARLASDSLAHPTPHPLEVVLHHSHPPVVERIHTLRAAPNPTRG